MDFVSRRLRDTVKNHEIVFRVRMVRVVREQLCTRSVLLCRDVFRFHLLLLLLRSGAPVVSPQKSSVPGRDDSTKVCSNPMGHVSSVPSTWCVGHFLAWLNRSSWVNRRFDGRHLGVVQKPATHRVSGRSTKTVQSARFRASLPDAKRPSRVSSCQKSAIRCPTPAAAPSPKRMTNSASLGKLVRVVAGNN